MPDLRARVRLERGSLACSGTWGSEGQHHKDSFLSILPSRTSVFLWSRWTCSLRWGDGYVWGMRKSFTFLKNKLWCFLAVFLQPGSCLQCHSAALCRCGSLATPSLLFTCFRGSCTKSANCSDTKSCIKIPFIYFSLCCLHNSLCITLAVQCRRTTKCSHLALGDHQGWITPPTLCCRWPERGKANSIKGMHRTVRWQSWIWAFLHLLHFTLCHFLLALSPLLPFHGYKSLFLCMHCL